MLSQIELQGEWERRFRTNPLKYFTPTGKQEEFIKKAGTGKAIIAIFSGANRVGKTAAEINILGNIIFGSQSKWFDGEVYKNWRYPKRARIGSTPKNLQEIGSIDVGIKEWFPENRYTAEKSGKQYNSKYTFDNGWLMDVMSYDQAVTEWESVSLGLVLFDEPPPKKIFDATIPRLADGGLILIFMTPLHDAGYLFDDLLVEGSNKEVAVTYVDIEDSCIEHGVRGFRKHDVISKILPYLDPEEIEARAHGKPMHLSGSIYKGFNYNVHVVDDFAIPENWQIVNICDPHDAKPFAFLWAAINPTNDYYIFDEFPNEPFDKIKGNRFIYSDYSSIVKDKESGKKIARRILDPNFGAKKMGNTGKTVQSELYEIGLEYELCCVDDLVIGHNAVRERLAYDPKNQVSSKPKLFVFRSCKNTWISLLRYGWKPAKNEDVSQGERLMQKYKHFADMVRYLCVTKHEFPIAVEDPLAKLPPLERKAAKDLERAFKSAERGNETDDD